MRVSKWFGGPVPADPREAVFVRTVAAAVAGWGGTDLTPADTSTATAYDNGTGCLVEIQVPNLTCNTRTLRVLYEPDDQPVLQSEWSDTGYAFDRPAHLPPNPGELYLAGLEVSPDQYGLWAAQWFERQLRRKVLRQEWDRPDSGLGSTSPARTSGPAAVRWTISDPEGTLDSRGGLRWWRLMRQPPAREILERS